MEMRTSIYLHSEKLDANGEQTYTRDLNARSPNQSLDAMLCETKKGQLLLH